MRPADDLTLTLPPTAVANRADPLATRLADARRFLAARGITEVRPLYGSRARS